MKTKIKLIVLIIVVLCVAMGGLYLGYQANLFTLPSFEEHPLTIDKTANVIEEVRKIGEFTSACYYEELAIRDIRVDTTYILGIKRTKTNAIVLVGKGRVRAGFDLSKLAEDGICAHGDTLDVVLPKAEIFDIIINPSDFSIEYESGDWNNESMKPVKAKAKTQLEENAIKNDLLLKATDSGISRLETLFQSFGFLNVNIHVME